MAFKVAKAAGARVPDMVDDIPADATSLPIASIENGVLVSIDASGKLVKAAPSASVGPAGILVTDAGDSRYAAPTGSTYTSTMNDVSKVTFIPVTGTLLIEADISGDATKFIVGGLCDIEATGWTAVGETTPSTNDFRILRLVKNAAGTTIGIIGVFVRTGYFAG